MEHVEALPGKAGSQVVPVLLDKNGLNGYKLFTSEVGDLTGHDRH